MKRYQLIMFDLDGTIADTSKGVIHSVKYTERIMGLEHLNEDIYKKFIGPPNRESYNRYYGLTDERLDQAVKYHKLYALEKGIFEADVYIGMRELLDSLIQNGKLMAVVTLKQQESAEKILRHFGLCHYFNVIAGDSGNNEEKSNLINQCVLKYGVAEKNAVLIGDSKYDQIGAMKSGVDFIGVTYGFGFCKKEDMKDLPCVAAADNVNDLYALLKGKDK